MVPWYACSPHLGADPLEAWSLLKSFIFLTRKKQLFVGGAYTEDARCGGTLYFSAQETGAGEAL